MRGLLTTTLLERIVEHRPDFLESIDFICGTSAGGLLALQIAAGYTPKEVSTLFNWASPHIFGYKPWLAHPQTQTPFHYVIDFID